MNTSVAVRTEAARQGLGTLKAGFVQATRFVLRDAMKAAEDSAKHTTLFQDRSHDTRESIRQVRVSPTRGQVRVDGAGFYLENGTPPHQIVARRARYLHFFINGREFFRRAVQHPGTAERPFMQQARDRAELTADYAADFYVRYAIEHAH